METPEKGAFVSEKFRLLRRGEREMLVQSMAGRAAVVRCGQPLDAQVSARLGALVAGSLQRARRVILDLSATAYADSAGLKALLTLQQGLQSHGAELRLVVPPGSRIDRALRLVGFASLLHLYPTGRLAWREAGQRRTVRARRRLVA